MDRCISEGFFLNPEAKDIIEASENPDNLLEEILESIPPDTLVIRPEHIEENRASESKHRSESSQGSGEMPPKRKSKNGEQHIPKKKEKGGETHRDKKDEDIEEKDKSEDPSRTSHESKEPNSYDKRPLFGSPEIVKDITGRSECEGRLKNFVDYFRQKYDRLEEEIRKRNSMSRARDIESLGQFQGECSIIGMVNTIRDTRNGDRLVILEDKSSEVPALALKDKGGVFKKSENIIEDEVIGLKGRTSSSSDLFIIEDIIWPDLPIRSSSQSLDESLFAIFISDIHFGSEAFLEPAWERLIKWLNGIGNDTKQKRIVDKVGYVFIAGDIVEGVGVYPGQKEELKIKSIKNQYKEAVRQIKRIPDHIHVVISPGNHDAVRQAEPQPALSDEISKMFESIENVHLVGNPSLVKIEDVRILLYHGRSLDDIISELPSIEYNNPEKAMVELVKRRHLAPTYGKKTPIAPEKEDYMFIESPDIIHCGHVHTFGIDNHRGVNLLNTGTWQGQTKFQKKKGIKPVPGRAVIYNLKNHEPKVAKFCD